MTCKMKRKSLLGLKKSTVKKRKVNLLSMSLGREVELLSDVRIAITNIDEIMAECCHKKANMKQPQKSRKKRWKVYKEKFKILLEKHMLN